jgi:hypothetical protein
VVRFAGAPFNRAATFPANILGNVWYRDARSIHHGKQRVVGHVRLTGALSAHGTACGHDFFGNQLVGHYAVLFHMYTVMYGWMLALVPLEPEAFVVKPCWWLLEIPPVLPENEWLCAPAPEVKAEKPTFPLVSQNWLDAAAPEVPN